MTHTTNEHAIIEAIVSRHIVALARTGDHHSTATVRLLLTLAVEEGIDRALDQWERQSELEICVLRSQLNAAQTQRTAAEMALISTKAQIDPSTDALDALHNWLMARPETGLDDTASPARIVKLAIEYLNRQEDELDALRAANERLQAARVLATISANGNGRQAGNDWSALSAEAQEWKEGMERGAHTWRKLPIAIRLELVQTLLRQCSPQTMDEYDKARPIWMPQASGLPRTFGVSWVELPTANFDSIKSGD